MTLWTIGYEKLWPDALKLAEHGIAYEHRRELLLEAAAGVGGGGSVKRLRVYELTASSSSAAG